MAKPTQNNFIHRAIIAYFTAEAKEGVLNPKYLKNVINKDWQDLLSSGQSHKSTIHAAKIADNSSWLKLWDLSLDWGPSGTIAISTCSV